MSYYARKRWVLEVSSASDYSRPVTSAGEYTSTPDEFRVNDVIEVATAGQTYTLSHLSSVEQVRVTNLDSTNYLDVTFRSAANGATDNKVRIAATKTWDCPDVTVANNLTLTANTAAVLVSIDYSGT